MANIEYYDVIREPVVTEKTMNLMSEKKYTFLVHPDATKTMIREAVEKMFDGVRVESVHTMNCDGKKKRQSLAAAYGRTSQTKKAVVKLTEDSADIEIFSGL